MDNFLFKLKNILDDVLLWSDRFLNGDKDYDYDIDDELYILSKKYDVDFHQGDLKLLYNLLDFYCDAVKHGFKEIDRHYSISEAAIDIKTVKEQIETCNDTTFELPQTLKDRLKGI